MNLTGLFRRFGFGDPFVPLCLVCKEHAYSWIEREGQRYGYCLKHQGQSRGSRSSESDSTAQKQQCLGTTKSGSRCRRQTSDPSGYCYQHKPR